VLIQHVPPPVIFSWKRLPTLFRPWAIRLGAVELLCGAVLVVNMSIQVGFGAKLHAAARMGTSMRSFVVSFVVTKVDS